MPYFAAAIADGHFRYADEACYFVIAPPSAAMLPCYATLLSLADVIAAAATRVVAYDVRRYARY